VTAVAVGALSPDLDALANLWDPLASITTHRVATVGPDEAVALATTDATVLRSRDAGRTRQSILERGRASTNAR
jgi:hypothetical protein